MTNITTTQITGLGWRRGVEDRYPGTNDASLSWGAYNKTTDGDFLSGMIASIRTGTGNEIVRADSTVRGGRFRGIIFTEVSKDIDESLGGAPPTVITGPATLFIRKSALVAGATYTAGGYLKAGTGATNAGRLTASSSGTEPDDDTVAFIQEVQTDGILIKLYQPTA